MMLRQGAVIAGRYEILEKLGVGGMANVYRARDGKLERDVTFKVMREEFVSDDEFRARFSIEARAAASLSDQNIVNVYDVGQEGLIHYIVMEYIDGVTLKDLILKRAPFADDEILGVAIQIAHALEHAHRNGIIHRDIKPQNILVTTTGIIKVTDFGIARAATANTITAASNTMGSVHYFSPEQARGGYVDDKSDIYALGIVMYEMAAGRLPFDGDTAISVALKHINESPEDISTFNPNTSDAVKRIIKKATEKQTAERYSNITDMCNELKRALTNNYSDDDNKASGSVALESSTIRFTADDIAQIQRESKEKNNAYDINDYDTVDPNNLHGEDFVDDFDEGYDYRYDERYDDYDEMYDDKIDKSTERKVIIGAVALALVIILGISLFLFLFLGNGNSTQGKERVDMPSLTGMYVDDMDELSKNLGIVIREVDSQYSDEFEAGQIISYEAPDEVYKGDTVTIVTSKGSDKVEVPDFVNKDISVALDLFRESKLLKEPSIERVFSEDIAVDVVIRQNPDAGTMTTADMQITLYVSKGPEVKMVAVPSVVNETEARAIEILQGLGLRVAQNARAYSSTVPEGRVIKQSIQKDEEVAEGTIVTITVSSGLQPPEEVAPPVTVPTKQLVVDPYIRQDTENIHMKILRIDSEGTTVFFDEIVSPTYFPHTFEVTGKGDVEFFIYFVDSDGREAPQARERFSFDD